MFRRAILLSWALTIVRTGHCQLIRPVPIYQDIIQGIHDYFNNTCIILLHATNNPIEPQGLKEGMALKEIQAYLSGRHILTATMDFKTFTARIGMSYYNIKRPLFVLLTDSDDLKRDFSEVTHWIDISYPTWLIFFRDETTIKDFFAKIYVPFDCTFMVAQGEGNSSREIITEVYQVDRDKELRHAIFGSWENGKGIKTPRLGLYQRRNDLFGHTIRVASIHDPPGSLIVRDVNGKMIGISGFYGRLLHLLEESMNCTVTYLEARSFGYPLDNGTWTGAIGLLTKGVVDLVAAELMMNNERMDAIDFTTPVYSTKCRAFIKRPSSSALKWKTYIAPFNSGIWSSIGVVIVVTSATISIVKIVVPPNMKDVYNSTFNFRDTVFAIFGAFCSQGMNQSSLDPVRLVHFVIHLTSVVVLSAYSAALTSTLTVKTFVMPFTTMAGLLEDGTYRFGVLDDSADYELFQNATDNVLRVLFDDVLTKEEKLPNSYYEGLKKVCKEEKYAFMTLENTVAQLQPKMNCTLEPLDTIMQASLAMGVRPHSPYRGIIDANILRFRDSGMLQRLLNTEWTLTANDRKSSWTIVEIDDILPLMIIIIFGIFFSFLTLGSEHLASKRRALLVRKTRTKKKHSTTGQ